MPDPRRAPALPEPIGSLTERTAPRAPDRLGSVTASLSARLTAADRRAIMAQLAGPLAALYDQADATTRSRLEVVLPVFYELADAVARLGIAPAVPPDPGPDPIWTLGAIGDALGADVIAEALAAVARSPEAGDRVFEFGCEWGQRLRLLAAWRDDVQWVGADDAAAGAGWAAAHLAPVSVQTSTPDGGTGEVAQAAFSLTVCGRLTAADAVRFLAAAADVVEPEGVFVLIVPGLHRLADDLAHGRLEREPAAYALRALYRTGHVRASVRAAPGYQAYLTLEWLLTYATAAWSVAHFAPGRMHRGDDVLVLRRR